MASPGGPNAMRPAVAALRRKLRPRTSVMLAAVVLVAAVIAVACAAQLTGPTDITPTRSMLIGTWRSTSGAVLMLKPDGTFTARSLPTDFGGPLSGAPTQGSGAWHVALAPPPPSVVFHFSGSPHTEVALGVERLGSSVIMYFDKGDPDQGTTGQYQFTKLRSG